MDAVLVKDDVRVADAVRQDALGKALLDEILVEVAVDLLVRELHVPALVGARRVVVETAELGQELLTAQGADGVRGWNGLAIDGRLVPDDEEEGQGAGPHK